MRIFVITSRVPWPLEKGDKLRIYHQLKHLHKNHEIFLCCLTDEKVDQKDLENLRDICSDYAIVPLKKTLILWHMILGLFSDRPFQVHYFFQRQARRKVYRYVDQFQPDHIYCQLIRAAEHVKHIHKVPKTLDYMDAFNKGVERRINGAPWYKRLVFRQEARRLVAYENLIYEYFEHHLIISEQDRDFIFHPRRQNIAVIPNGVDQAFFSPIAHPKKYDLVFTGNMNYPPNIDCAVFLAKEVLPLVRKSIPDATLLLAGAQPAPQVKALNGKGITVTGWLDDIRLAYAESSVFVAPMRIGSGLQNKLLEAMSMELPCITSPLANNALHAHDGEEILVATQAHEVADHCISLLRDAELARNIALNGRRFVQERYSWEHTAQQLEELMMAN
ncbi:MAG: glycosyltransferase [Flavobacteriales bacterium]|nr:glycosyltransferase [Flavobacteriales bacterium]